MTQLQNPSSGEEAGERPATTHAPAEAARVRRLPFLWRNRDFQLLWSGQLVSTIGSQVSLLAFPLLVLAITHSPAQAGLVGAAREQRLSPDCIWRPAPWCGAYWLPHPMD